MPVKVFAGEQKKYTVQVTNLGPSDAVNVVMTDMLPGEMIYEIDTGLCDDAGNTVTCEFGDMSRARAGQRRHLRAGASRKSRRGPCC